MPFQDVNYRINLEDIVKPASKAVSKGRKTFCITGPTGVGKTFTAGTIPAKDEGLYLDFDDKSALLQTSEHDNLKIVDVKFSRDRYRENSAVIQVIMDSLVDGELKDKYQWGFLDGLSGMYNTYCHVSFDQVKGSAFSMNYDRMDFADDKVWRLIERFMGVMKYTVLYAHEDYRQGKDSVMKVLPLARKSLSEAIPGRFQEVYHATTKGSGDEITYHWETRPMDVYHCNSLIPGLPYLVPNNFGLLLGTDWTKNKEMKEVVEEHEKVRKAQVTKWKT